MDALLSLYGRQRLEELDVQELVHPLCRPDSVASLSGLYQWSIVTIDDIDSPKYTISIRLSEVCDPSGFPRYLLIPLSVFCFLRSG